MFSLGRGVLGVEETGVGGGSVGRFRIGCGGCRTITDGDSLSRLSAVSIMCTVDKGGKDVNRGGKGRFDVVEAEVVCACDRRIASAFSWTVVDDNTVDSKGRVCGSDSGVGEDETPIPLASRLLVV